MEQPLVAIEKGDEGTLQLDLIPCGDRHALLRLGAGVDEATNRRVHAAARALAALGHPALREAIPGYNSLLVEYDPVRLSWLGLRRLVEAALARLAAGEEEGADRDGARTVEVPVWYGGEAGPDLEDVAAHAGLTPDQVVALHAAGTYRVYCLGFSPGFCYLGGLDPRLHTPRLPSPRTRVPAGSVAIGGQQTGIYPAETPGGWRIIGRTPLVLFDPWRDPPSLLQPGDRVRFVPITEEEFRRLAPPPRREPAPPPETGRPGLRILQPGLLTTVQDTGRRGYQALGVPVAGAMDYWAIMVGNWLLGNRSRAAALEITLQGPEVEFTGPVAFCLTGAPCQAELVPAGGGSPRPVPMWASLVAGPGDRLRIGPLVRGCRAYLCVAGGLDVPAVLGSRSEDLFARLGPLGRPLKAGDWLPVGEPVLPPADLAGRALSPADVPEYRGDLKVRAVPGPQADAFAPGALDQLAATAWRVGATSDRQGARLEGPALPLLAGADIVSEGIPPGAVQVPAGGQPILLLANRQTLGGYAKIAVVVYPDVARAAQLRPGDTLRFQLVDLAEAHRIAWAERRRLAQVRRFLQRQAPAAVGRGWAGPVAVELPVPAAPGAPAAVPSGAGVPAPGAAPPAGAPAMPPAPGAAGLPEGAVPAAPVVPSVPAAPPWGVGPCARHLKVRVGGVEFDAWVEEF